MILLAGNSSIILGAVIVFLIVTLLLVLLLLYAKAKLTPKGKVKLEIGVARGKHLYDKRQDMKDKTVKREMERRMV